jgi:predicted nucleic acid-binding protein
LLGFFEREISLLDHTMSSTSQAKGAAHDTMSGLSLVIQEGNVKHEHMGAGIRRVFSDLLLDILSLYAQYMPSDAKRRIFSEEENRWLFEPLDVLAIQGRYDINVYVSNASANKAIARRDAGELYQMAMQNPIVNPVKAVGELLKSYERKDAAEWIKPEVQQVLQALMQAPELPQVIQQYMQQKQQQAADQETAREAQDNVRRQQIEREVERPIEDQKIVDQAQENIKRQAVANTLKAANAGVV